MKKLKRKYSSQWLEKQVWTDMKLKPLFLMLLVNADLIFSTESSYKISIITSVYKGKQFIKGFMEDIVKQTVFNQCQMIMINANSPDHEEDVINPYLEKYPNIIYIKLNHDPGLYAVWNMAIKMCHSDYITNANLDDRLKEDSIEMHAKALDEHPEIDLVYCDNYISDVPNAIFENPQTNLCANFPEFSKKAMLACLPHCHPMWRTSLHEKYGYFNEKYNAAGDYEMWLRAVDKGAQFLKIKGLYGVFYLNPNTPCSRKGNSWEIAEIYHNYRHMLGLDHLTGHQISSLGGKSWKNCIKKIK